MSKRRKVEAGDDTFPRSEQAAHLGTRIQSLPVEIIHKILILSGSSALPKTNRYFYYLCHHAPVSVRAAFIISRYWTAIREEAPHDNDDSPQGYRDESAGKVLRVRFGNAALPPLLMDARELVSVPSPWVHIEQAFWDKLIRSSKLADRLRNPLDYALKYPICTSAVIDAFSAMLYRIPTLAELAGRVTWDGRMRVSKINSELIDRVWLPNWPQPLSHGIEDARPDSALVALVAELDDRSDLHLRSQALETFLRVLFWHFDSPTTMPLRSRPAPTPLLYQALPKKQAGSPHANSVGLGESELSGALFRCSVRQSLWALRLLLRFEKKSASGPPDGANFNMADADVASSAMPALAAAAASSSSPADFLPSLIVHQGWLEGLRVALEFESPDEVLLESRVCNDIARYLLDHVLDPTEPFFADELARRAPLPSFTSTDPPTNAAAAGGPSSSSSPSLSSSPRATGSSTTTPTPLVEEAPPPPAVMFARAARRPVQSAAGLLTTAIQAGHFDIAKYLMERHGAAPDMNTISALEKLRRRRRRDAGAPSSSK